jgi:pimeloyl-ACP methyl ester carboxylesterase
MREEQWNGFLCHRFDFEDREAILVFPKNAEKDRRWLFKMEYMNAFPAFEIAMLNNGWHVAYIKNRHRWCDDEDIDIKKRFADFLKEKYGLFERLVPVGLSCGGLFAVKFAAKYPKYVSALYLDAPVLNLLSCPADMGVGKSGLFPEFHKATGMTKSDLLSYREHPIDKLSILLQHKIPIVLVYGVADTVVPYCENGAILEQYYQKIKG